MLEKIGKTLIIGCIAAIAIVALPFQIPSLAEAYLDKKAGHHFDRLCYWLAEKFGPIGE